MSATKNRGRVFDPGLCRCCGTMKKCRVLTLMYDSNGEREIYADMIMDSYGLMMSHLDGKPTERLICANCVHRLRDALAFKRQVQQCEEAFLEMKMYDAKVEGFTPAMLTSMPTKVEVEIVKMEPRSPSPFALDHHDDPMDHDHGSEPDRSSTAPATLVKAELKLDRSEDADRTEPRALRGAPPAGGVATRQRPPASAPASAHKNNMTLMAKKQQMIRERDTSYKVLCNTSTVVEYSYACPFKCRHNHLICYYCGETFMDPNDLRKHTEEKHHPKNFSIAENRRNLTKIDLYRIDCRLCPAKIETIEEFKKHITQTHKKKYYLESKDSILPFKLVLNEWMCALCNATFPYFHALNRHMNTHYSNCVCEICGQGFVDGRRFLMHKLRHEDGNYPCPDCGKIFKQDYNRELHIDRVHKKKGRIYCPKCHKVFMSYQMKLKHLVEEHGEEPLCLPCSVCKETFPSRRHLTLHMRKVHLKDYRHECQYCGQKFFTRTALTSHMPTHTGERNYKCKVCEKTYPRPKTLREHMRIHNNDRRYRCHVCGQAFIQNCSLKGHMKSQHPEYE